MLGQSLWLQREFVVLPDAKEIHGDLATEDPLELITGCLPVCVLLLSSVLIHLIRKADLRIVARRKEANLVASESHEARDIVTPLTVCSMPARARAVYAPREKPKMLILSPRVSARH